MATEMSSANLPATYSLSISGVGHSVRFIVGGPFWFLAALSGRETPFPLQEQTEKFDTIF